MNGAHDLGGMHGFGPVEPEPDEPVFHAEWEKRAFALTLAMGYTGSWTVDMARYARESLHPAVYLRSSYYEIWLAGLERLMRERDLLRDGEIEAGRALGPVKPVDRPLAAADTAATLAAGNSARRDAADAPAPRFREGDRVRTRILNPTGHIRLPRYCRGRPGTIAKVNGRFVLPDASAAGKGDCPQTLYSVRFSGTDLWGRETDPSVHVHADLWESYLEPA